MLYESRFAAPGRAFQHNGQVSLVALLENTDFLANREVIRLDAIRVPDALGLFSAITAFDKEVLRYYCQSPGPAPVSWNR